MNNLLIWKEEQQKETQREREKKGEGESDRETEREKDALQIHSPKWTQKPYLCQAYARKQELNFGLLHG